MRLRDYRNANKGTAARPAFVPVTNRELRAEPLEVEVVSMPMSPGAPSEVGLTDDELRASPVPVVGVVAISGTVPISGAVTVNVGLTDGQLRAAPVPISGTVTAKQPARVQQSLVYSGAPTITDTMLSTGRSVAGANPAAAVSHTVPAGKKWRILSASLSIRATTAANPWAKATIRWTASGAAANNSPVAAVIAAGGTAAVIGNTAAATLSFGEGIELGAGQQVGISAISNLAANVLDVSLQIIEIDA
jgi:hypothetical protein